jgi:enolase
MSRSPLAELTALEILDSRGRPTVRAFCVLSSGARGDASVPAGASTGAAEARELRDGDPARYGGLGCRRAVAGIEGEIAAALVRRTFPRQADLDRSLCELDGTETKERLGANALLAVSVAYARAAAAEDGVPLYEYAATLVDSVPALPRPFVNLFSGGVHGGSQVSVQDVQLLVHSAASVDEALSAVHDIYREAVELTAERYGMRLLRADEGGLAPPFADSEDMLAAAVECIARAGFRPGPDVALAVDVAATHFAADGYLLDGEELDRAAMVERAAAWLRDFPIVCLEDPLAEEDWDGWAALLAATNEALLLGDDLLCTQVLRIERAVALAAANGLLLKPNQVGTLTEAAESLRAARAADWTIVVSARSGETEDDWLADLAAGWAAEHIKIGSITQSERLAKYNRLLAIERELA